MTKFIFAVLASFVMSCGNSTSNDQQMYDTTSNAAPGAAAARDSVTAAAARDSARAYSSNKSSSMPASTQSGGGVPKGTIDSGMNNAGAHPHGKSHHAK